MNGTFWAQALLSIDTRQTWWIIGTGDFSQDGKIDLLLTNYATGENVMWVMSRLTYQSTASIQSDTEANWRSSTVGDFNNNGKPDIVKTNYATGENAFWLMNGLTYQGAGPLPTYSNFYTNPAASTNNLTFTGREDDGTGVLYYPARYYAPRLQRFISEDPLRFDGGDINLYRSVSNQPNTAADPSGLFGNGDSPSAPFPGCENIDCTDPYNVTASRGRIRGGDFSNGGYDLKKAGRTPKLACGPACPALRPFGQAIIDGIAVGLGLWNIDQIKKNRQKSNDPDDRI